MCTVFTLKTKDFYVGRNLDLEYEFGERVVFTPRNFTLKMRFLDDIDSHYAILGMANVTDNTPLYAEAMNETGLTVAGLYFPGNARYQGVMDDKINLAPFEIIPYILGKYKSVYELEMDLSRLNIVNVAFSDSLPISPMHFIVADETGSYVLEPMSEGLKIYKNDFGVLTNNPPFPFHIENMKHYMKSMPVNPENTLAPDKRVEPFGQGFGMFGIPGDTTPSSRFVKTVFLKENSACDDSEESSISQVFHILDNVSFVRGSTVTKEGRYDITTYSSCMNATKGIYYYTTYENRGVNAIKMESQNLDGDSFIEFPLDKKLSINYC